MNDSTTTIDELKRVMARFVAEREWEKFHDAKNLSASIAIEAAELMEHFQWLRSEELAKVKNDANTMSDVRDEIADIAAYVLSFANQMDIDLAAAIEEKMKKNAAKYPADKFRGKSR